jgi:signal transduction histidine kinase
MENKKLILIEQFCKHHEIEFSFINSLQEFGLIEIVVFENEKYIPEEQLNDVEKMIRLHYELEINMQGIDAVFSLLKQINDLQQELTAAKNKLRLFEGE